MPEHDVRTFVVPAELEPELEALARRYAGADGLGLQVLNLLGTQAENLLQRLPEAARGTLEEATIRALKLAMKAARQSHGPGDGPAHWLNRAAATVTGAAGGFGGLPTALAELPVTVTVLMRAIQAVAIEHGFDPAVSEVERECLAVLAADGPLETAPENAVDLNFLTARAMITGSTLQALIARVAPRLSISLGQKLAAQAVPVIGAVAGAATNYAYVSYYQEIAQVHFRLRRLSLNTGLEPSDLAADVRLRVKKPSIIRS